MKMASLILLACAALAFGGDAREMKKLGSVIWEPETKKLIWVVQKGTFVDGKFEPTSEQRYEVRPKESVMVYGTESRPIEEDEAVSLHKLLDVLALYCAQSVAWWDHGGGLTPAKPDSKPTTKPEGKPKTTDSKVVKASVDASPVNEKPCGTVQLLHARTNPGTSDHSWQ